MVNAVADLSIGVRNVLRLQSTVDRLPRLAAIVRTESARGGNGDPNPLRIFGIENDAVETHAARARLPVRARAVTAQARHFLPVLPALGGFENRRIFHARVNQ